MKNTNVLTIDHSQTTTRFLRISIFAVVSLFIFALAYTASAATLTRQLELGMSGADVTALQVFLAKDSTIYPQGIISGYFGSLTKSAVSNFQARNGISNIGRVGPATLAAINAQMNGDNGSPSINSVSVSPTTNTANINWNTNENSSAVVYYGTSVPSMIEASPTTGVTIGGSSLLVNTNMQSNHAATLSNLLPNTSYYYVLYVKDGIGNESITWPTTFRTQ